MLTRREISGAKQKACSSGEVMCKVPAPVLGTFCGALQPLGDNTGPRMQTVAVMLLNAMYDSHGLGGQCMEQGKLMPLLGFVPPASFQQSHQWPKWGHAS